MTRTIWLASYPKSGNTWLRLLIANLSARDGQPVDINDLPECGEIASARQPFDELLLIDSGLLTHDEIDRLRPRVCEALACGADEDDEPDAGSTIRFVKAHDAYTLTAAAEPLLAGARGAAGAIVIVRDPRAVAPSLASHMGTTIDEAIAFMNDANAGLCAKPTAQDHQLPQKLLGWSGHLASWLDQSDIPVQLLRYEDLQRDTAGALRRVLAFAGRSSTENDIQHAVACADFAQLRQQEDERGFREAPRPRPGGKFFRRGEVSAWRDELTADQVARLEADHAPMMQRLGYELSDRRLDCAEDHARSAPRCGARFDRPVFIVSAPRSGSTFLFETMAEHETFWTVGGEAHQHIEGIPALRLARRGFHSNRLTADDASPDVRKRLRRRFLATLRNVDGRRYRSSGDERPAVIRFLEKTPKNALRIPFLKAIFPEAKFVFLHRDASSNISSIIEAWCSGRFVTYRALPGWTGLPWSLVLIPGWRELRGADLGEIALRQWRDTNEMILRDLEAVAPSDWTALGYEELIAHPRETMQRLCAFAELPFSARLRRVVAGPLTLSRYTLAPPDADKWRKHEQAIAPLLAGAAATAAKLGKLAGDAA